MKLVEAAAVLLVAFLVAPVVRGLWVDLPSTGTKCVSEELHNSVVVLGDYHSFFGQNDDLNHTVSPSISVKVKHRFPFYKMPVLFSCAAKRRIE